MTIEIDRAIRDKNFGELTLSKMSRLHGTLAKVAMAVNDSLLAFTEARLAANYAGELRRIIKGYH